MSVAETLIVVSQNYSAPPQTINADELEAAVAAGDIVVPRGWSLDSAYRVTLAVGYGASGSADEFSTPAAATAVESVTLPVVYAFLSRGIERLEVEIVDTRDRLAQPWVDSIMSEGSPEPVPLGRGFAGGPTSVIDRGKSLLRATYDDGVDARSFDMRQVMDRAAALQEKAQAHLADFR